MQPQLAAAILNLMDWGVVVVDRRAHVCAVNEVASAILARSDALSLDGERLEFLAPTLEHRFQQFITDVYAAPPLARSGTRWACSVPRSTGEPDYRLVVNAFIAPASDQGDAETHVCITVHDPSTEPRADASILRQLYRLTPTEAEITAALFGGMTVERITDARDVSENTVRTHLKSIFSKCEVRSQAELVRLIALAPRAAFT